MEITEYKQLVAERINSLSEEDQNLLGSIEKTPAGQVIMKVLGPELFGQQPQEQQPQEQQQPAPQPAPRPGLGAR